MIGFPCLLKALCGLPCLSCGGTRALTALIRLDLAGAVLANPLVALLFLLGLPGLIILGLAQHLDLLRPRPRFSARERLLLRFGTLLVLTANWGYMVLRGG